MSPLKTLSSCGNSSRLSPSEPCAQLCHAVVVFARLRDHGSILEDGHGAKFENLECTAAVAGSRLPEESGTRQVAFYGNCDRDERRRQKREGECRQDDIDRTLATIRAASVSSGAR